MSEIAGRMSRSYLLIVFFCFLLCVPSFRVQAAPALTSVGQLSQPTGEHFQAEMKGDEFSNWYILQSGEIILKDADGFWKYAQINTNQLQPGSSRVLLDPKPAAIVTSEQWGKVHEEKNASSQSLPFSPFLTNPVQSFAPPPATIQYTTPTTSAPAAVTSPDSTTVMSTSSQQGAPMPAEAPQSAPSLPPAATPQKALVLLVSFTDRSIQYGESAWVNAFFGTTGKTVRTYYQEVSNGKNFYFTPAAESHGTVNDGVVSVTLSYPHPNPGSNTDSRNQKIVRDALTAADPNVNFASFDTNNNGVIELSELHIVTIIAGYDQSSGNYSPSVWGHRWSLWNGSVAPPILDGKALCQYPYGGYTQQGEIHGNGGNHMATTGILVHELGHDLGLADMYDTTYASQGVGVHSLMAGGSWGRSSSDAFAGITPTHIDPYQKILLGFVTPTLASSPGTYTVNAASTGAYNVLKVPTSDSNQYFLLENRQLSGFDQGLFYQNVDTGGVAIWHVDESVTGSNWSSNSVNNNVSHKGLDVEEANEKILGYNQLDLSYYDSTTPYRHYFGAGVNTAFSSTTEPNSNLYSGADSGVQISIPGSSAMTMNVVIGNPASQIQFNPDTYTVAENTGSVMTTVTRTGDTNSSVTASYTTSDGTAKAGSDYTATSGAITFAAGEISKTITVPILDNSVYGGNKTFSLALSNPTNGASLGTKSTATITIIDDEFPPPTLQFSSATYSTAENAGSATITVTRTGNTSGVSTVDYATSNGTAISGSDYTSTSGTLTFGGGETSKSFTIPIIDNAIYEGNKTVTVALSNPSGAILGTPVSATLTIIDDELSPPPAPILQFSSATYRVAENAGSATITVTRTGNTSGASTVDYATSNGTASAGSNYTSTSGTLTFGAGETSKTFAIPIIDDAVYGGDKTVNVALSNPSGATLGSQSSSVLTITDDETPPTPPTPPTTPIDLKIPNTSLKVGSGSTVTATLYAVYPDGTQVNVAALATWTSSHPNVASINAGQITGGDAGSTIITVSYGGITKTFTLYVR